MGVQGTPAVVVVVRWHLQLPLLSSVGTCSCRCCCRHHLWAPAATGVVAVGGPGGDAVVARRGGDVVTVIDRGCERA